MNALPARLDSETWSGWTDNTVRMTVPPPRLIRWAPPELLLPPSCSGTAAGNLVSRSGTRCQGLRLGKT